MTTHRCYIPVIEGSTVRVPEEQAHHLGRVLRLAPGDDVVVFDGRGHEWLARVASMKRNDVMVELVEMRPALPEPPVAITLAIGMLKGDQMSAVVRDATALGVAAIVPFASQHVALPPDAWRTRTIDRSLRIAISSATQCGRSVVPVIHDVRRLADLLVDGDWQTRWMCVEPARHDSAAISSGPGAPAVAGSALLLVGPEGGWSDDEVNDARAAGVEWLHLGPRTLRAEIAPTVALSALWARLGWVAPLTP